MIVAIIPARKGSKRVPHKNIKKFYDRPMIGWPITTALNSGCFDQVIVSTDCKETSDIARRYGAETPFDRPENLADDFTPTSAVVKHAISWLAENRKEPSIVCCIYATAALISPSDLKNGLKALQEHDADFAISVSEYSHPIERALKCNQQGYIEMLDRQKQNVRSQDLMPAWHDAGQFYWGFTKSWKENKQFFAGKSVPLFLPANRAKDIDTKEDWKIAELLFAANSKGE